MQLRLAFGALCAAVLFGQTIPIAPQWTNSAIIAAFTTGGTSCFDPSNAVQANGTGYVALTVSLASVTCYDYNLDGSVAHGPFNNGYASAMLFANAFNFTGGEITFRMYVPTTPYVDMAVWLQNAGCQATYPYTTRDATGCIFSSTSYYEMDLFEQNSSAGNSTLSVYGQGNVGGHCPYTYTTGAWHTYVVDWVPGASVTLSVDSSTVCTISQSYVPNGPMFPILEIGEMLPITSGQPSTPQSVLIDYIQITQGGVLIFDDEFPDTGGAGTRGVSTARGGSIIR